MHKTNTQVKKKTIVKRIEQLYLSKHASYRSVGVHQIVIFAEAEYSAEWSLPKPNIRHAE